MNAPGVVRRFLPLFKGEAWKKYHDDDELLRRLIVYVVALAVVPAVSAFSAFFPLERGLSGQLMIVPILLAMWAFRAPGALSGAVWAAAWAPFVGHGGTPWEIQSLMYVVFGGMCALVVRTEVFGRQDAALGEDRTSEEQLVGSERILESLARTVEVRDHQTQGHCRRVAKNALAVGRILGLSTENLNVLYWSALLHDLGKIAVPDYILLKNGPLSEEEYAEIRRHPSYGADLLTSVSNSFRPIADVVRAHHERWDGLGYPLGSRDVEIPLLARIIAVVDVFEALTSERPYRSPMPFEQALKYINHGAGSQFDPDIVAAFERLVASGVIERALDQTGAVRAELGKPPLMEMISPTGRT